MPDPQAPNPSPAAKAGGKPTEGFNSYPWWALRIWSGMRFTHFFRMLRQHGYRIDPQRIGMALVLGQMTPWNSSLYGLQQLLFGRKIRDAKIEHPPVFIIGHWRSGTTHLHELLIRDRQFGYATTYQCFAPWHFVVSEGWLGKILNILLPSKRPMDNMATGMGRPQEDEFGLTVMGAPSMYYRMGFPKDPAEHLDTLTMRDVTGDDRRRFIEAITFFYRALTYKHGKRLLLKSPPHTGRIEFLSTMFPGAKFVHISRHPYSLFPSMQRTWRALYEAQGFQLRDEYGPEFDEHVHQCYEAMYDHYDQQADALAPGQYCEVRYEQLAADPLGVVKQIYDTLELPGYDAMQPALAEYVASLKDYQPNRLKTPETAKDEIDRRWAWYFQRFGYAPADSPTG
ncbi:Sulfotransferase domain protein [Posidoniimonas polymericola]|uniref:Sulfotransferase domain protein n=1 Tax=Posidoniimonas polymericola TaxID=2528002 RepID=A0A5C5XQB6_9BACT|nr:sulfotransferase [Posidoniimonas polymericola]TWT65416.1 Sulfotransferase domain protein [Posidoniimonas polymericola]